MASMVRQIFRFNRIRDPRATFGWVLVFAVLLMSVIGIMARHEVVFLPESKEVFWELLNSFRQTHQPQIELNFSALYGENAQFQVLHPLLDQQNVRVRTENPSCRDDGEISWENINQRDALNEILPEREQ